MVDVIGTIDVAQAVLYVFWVLFAYLIWTLRAEDRREGYPLEEDVSGEYPRDPWLFVPRPKTFILPHGEGTRAVPMPDQRDTRPVKARRSSPWDGAPYVPDDDPLNDGIGPAAWAERGDHPERTPSGAPKIVPLRLAHDFAVPSADIDPRGLRVVGADQLIAGEITDIWVDQSESIVRYLEVTVGDERRLLPSPFAKMRRANRGNAHEIYVHALTSAQFPGIPPIASSEQVTRLEEDKVVGYFGGGSLYATPRRAEPFL